MAERRMFAKTIIDSDAFCDMPLSTQALYFHLSMRADDDGFLNNPRKIQRMVGCSDDDLKILIAKKFLIAFDSGVVVVKHWRINNYLRNDRYKATVYREEKAQLFIKPNGAYTFDSSSGIPLSAYSDTKVLPSGIPSGIPNGIPSGTPTGIPSGDQTVYQCETQYRLGKVSIDKGSIDKCKSNTQEDSITIAQSDEDDLSFVSPVKTGSTRKKAEKVDESPVVFQLMLNDKSLFDVHKSMIDEYTALYPAVNVEQEFRNMIGWIDSNPNKRKTRTGIRKFINSWLAREQDRGGRMITSADQAFRIGKTGQKMTLEQDHTLDGIL